MTATAKPAGKLHLTIDGKSSICERPRAKESTPSYLEVTCSWCIGRVKNDPIRYLVAFAQAGAPTPVLQQLWTLASAKGDPVARVQQKLVDLDAELTLQQGVLNAIGEIVKTHHFE